ncbi:hypothetical protein KCP73_23480 [Salmonella enterica subsp. enterica]|nr:hypothetical protein KCP73_23480 [Salmonella enterica subsp. enterica]
MSANKITFLVLMPRMHPLLLNMVLLTRKIVTGKSGESARGVNRIAPLTTGDVVLQSARSVAVGVMLGIDPAQKDPCAVSTVM